MKNTNTCAYCGKEGLLTKEHVYPDFFKQFFNTHCIITDQVKINNFPVKPLDITINDVCKNCNNNTLANLDRYGKSIINQIVSSQKNESIKISYNYTLLIRWLLKIQYNIYRCYKLTTPIENLGKLIIRKMLRYPFHLYTGRINSNIDSEIIGFKQYSDDGNNAFMIVLGSIFFVISVSEIDKQFCNTLGLCEIIHNTTEISLNDKKDGVDYLELRQNSNIIYPEVINRKLKSIISIPKKIFQITKDENKISLNIEQNISDLAEIIFYRFENKTQIAIIPINSKGNNITFFEADQSRKKWAVLIRDIKLNNGNIKIILNNNISINHKVTMINGTIEYFGN